MYSFNIHFFSFFFFFNDTATTEIYPLPLHAALPISLFDFKPSGVLLKTHRLEVKSRRRGWVAGLKLSLRHTGQIDRKSTRLNSSHGYISYAVFCLKKKKQK